MNAPVSSPVPIVHAIAPLAATSDAWLVDIWGVMHNGVAPFATAVEACRRFRDCGKLVLLLSNAPRPADAVAAQLDRIGVPRDAYDGIVSSGDASRAAIRALGGNAPVFHLGPARDLPLYDGLDVNLVAPEAARAIVCTGLFDDETETPGHYADLLAGLAARRLPMICANPDLTVQRGDRIVYCAGAIAAEYETVGGAVTYAGKPFPPIYDMAFAAMAALAGREIARQRTLAIGDGLRTDIEGARRAGLRAVFVASGVHVANGHLDERTLAELFAPPGPQPVAAMPALAW
jgi:HAD superfamily hydrolase (TIGR01459 family)